MEKIKIKGDELLNKNEKELLNKLLNEYFSKVERKLKKSSLDLHIKIYDKEGQRKKFSLNLRALSPAGTIEASDADWDFARTLHKVFNKLIIEIEHQFHISDQHKR
jgi:hypothetical protein